MLFKNTRQKQNFFFFSLHILILSVKSEQLNNGSTNNRNYVALILARGGSKGIPNKNLEIIENKSLLTRMIETALKSKVFSSVWVSTDYLTIYKEAENAGARVYGRSKETATDTASSLEAVIEFCNFFTNITVLALLQCTSPFQSVLYLKKAYKLMDDFGHDSVFSVTPDYKLRWKNRTKNHWEPVNFKKQSRPRRQDVNSEFVENGMFYWFRTELVKKRVLQGDRIGTVIIPRERSLEIDVFDDLIYARLLAKKLLPKIENENFKCFSDEN